LVNEAQECLGGAGYVEESVLPRLYRQAPLNSIWEGSGNIQCLDVLRALARETRATQALRVALGRAAGLAPVMAREAAAITSLLAGSQAVIDVRALYLVHRIALALRGAALHADGSPVAEAFVRSRLDGSHGLAMGTLPPGIDFAAV